jgi:cobaltochelatase CobT
LQLKNSPKNFEKIKEDLLSTYQNIAQNPYLRVDFDENLINNFFSWNQNIVDFHDEKFLQKAFFFKGFLPNSNLLRKAEDEAEILTIMRPSLDLSTCYGLFHNAKIHQKYKFEINNLSNLKINVAKIFDDCERARIVILASDCYLGIVKNILAKIENDIFYAEASNLDLLILNNFFAKKILPKTQEFVQNLQKNLAPKIVQKFFALEKFIYHQENFAKNLKLILEELIIENEEIEQNPSQSTPEEQKQTPKESENFGAESVENNSNQIQNTEILENSSAEKIVEKQLTEMPIFEDENFDETIIDKPSIDNNKIEFKNPYTIFSNQFDEVINPKKFIAKNELENLRNQLDLKISKLNSISKKMSLKLKRKLLSKKNNYLEFDASGGVLNRKKLVNLVLSPLIEDVWINSKAHEYHDTTLTILLDNSGSMRGNPIVMSAMACEIIAEILEKFSIKTEIIGFTTSDWKGGRVRKLWETSGRKKNPGRLNELRHIIYKSFNQSFKKSKINLGLMLKEGILKENIDGEALLFARSRLSQQSEKRKILMVISDGTPVDDSTTCNNDGDILSDHLRHVINIIEKRGKIEIIGVGIGHATDDFYKNSITIKALEDLGDVMIDKIINVL